MRLRAMTFNLRLDTARDGANAWIRRRDRVASVVRSQRPDVLGTQEGLAHQLQDLDARLPGYARIGGCRRGDGTDEHAALYYDRDRYRLEACGDVWFSDTPHVPGSATWGNRLPRHATWAKLRDADDCIVEVVNLHLDHMHGGSRLAAAHMLARAHPDAVLMGDFNAKPLDRVHSAFLEACWRDTHPQGRESGGTYHAFTGIPKSRIDWILAPRDCRVLAHKVVRPRFADGRFASDHDPVVAELWVPPIRHAKGVGVHAAQMPMQVAPVQRQA